MEEEPTTFDAWSTWWQKSRRRLPEEERLLAEGRGRQKGRIWIQNILARLEGNGESVGEVRVEKSAAELRGISTQSAKPPDTIEKEHLHLLLEAILDQSRDNARSTIENAGANLLADREVIVEAAKVEEDTFRYASEELRNNKDFLLEVLKCKGMVLAFAPEAFRADKSVVMTAVQQDGYALSSAAASLRADREVVLAAVKAHGGALKHASAKLCADREIVLAAVECQDNIIESVLKLASEKLREDRELVLEAVKKHGLALRFASLELRADREVVFEAMKTFPGSLQYASEALQMDQDLRLLALRATRKHTAELKRTDFPSQYERLKDADGALQFAFFTNIAVYGEDAPILSVNMTHSDNHDVGSDGPKAAKEFHCHVSLLSGTNFVCRLRDCSTIDRWGTRRQGPILDDLALMMVQEMRRHTEMAYKNKVFINFVTDDGDYVITTPSEWDRPLSDFLPPTSAAATCKTDC
mmetsp:Transcript_10676/g.23324  ORF Transcript_10676/g.23324 Transcript_10676/m.23324 type:complete len:471 (+) Transcript_10676:65-1477(+)